MRIVLALVFLVWSLPAIARDVEVDVQLFLAVDVSRSMSPVELEIQRRGYASALTSDEVLGAVRNGMIGRIAVTYVEWAGEHAQSVVVPWTLIDSAESAAAVAGRITAHFDDGMRRTSISGALLYAADSFADNGFTSYRRVIDVSGDGPNNQGRPVLRARAAVLDRGFTINGLPLMTQDAFSERWGIPDLDVYYERCVIGGPGAFVIPVLHWDEFAMAVRRKLVLEIGAAPALAPATAVPVQYVPPAPYNCMVGEDLWERNRMYFDYP
ncbi:MAG: DUF1194 domain-containing protein [Rhodobacteraceae bacterium]|nr:DUF1194 domain-containing protein [Paracoccaceae bacterium]